MSLKKKYHGTFQTELFWLIPFVIGISKTNINYEVTSYTIQITQLFQFSFLWKQKSNVPKEGATIVDWARYYAYKWHRSTNHYYGKYPNEIPYEKHLEMVEAEAMKFLFLLPNDWNLRRLIIAACLLHDAIEDARVTYNDVKQALGEELAEFAFALCNEKGKNRKERANAKYYAGIRGLKYATFVKMCDRLANVRYSLSPNGGRMAGGYLKENPHFVSELYLADFKPMFDELDTLLKS